MWKIIYDTDVSNEPAELRSLKEQLATNSCRCDACGVGASAAPRCHKRVQAPARGRSLRDARSFCDGSSARRDAFCPGCYVALNLLAFRDGTVLKDEESETKSEMFSCDKSTERVVKFMEMSTSMPSGPTPAYSRLTLCDDIVELCSDLSFPSTKNKRRSNERVTFRQRPKIDHAMPLLSRNCLCMENFVNSIRPPVTDAVRDQ